MKGGSHLCAPNYCRRYRPQPAWPRRSTPQPLTWASAASSVPNRTSSWISTQERPPERPPSRPPPSATRLPAIARYWWLTALRGLVALILALAIAVAGRSTARLVTFLAWTLGAIVLGMLEVGLGVLLLLTNEVDPDLLVPIVAA
jgi:hypothetical protein